MKRSGTYLFFLLLIFTMHVRGQGLGVFDTIKNIQKPHQGEVLRQIYKAKLSDSEDTTFVFSQLDALYRYATDVNDRLLGVKALRMKSDYYWYNIENGRKQGVSLLRRAIEECKQYSLQFYVIDLYNRLGITLLLTEEYEEGFTFMLQSERLIDGLEGKTSENLNVSLCLLNIGWTYAWFSNHDRAIDYYKRALKRVELDTITTIFIYNSMGISYQETKRIDTSLLWFKRAFDLAINIADSSRIGLICSNLGWIYQLKKEASLARPLLVRAMRLLRKDDCWSCMANISMNLGYVDLMDGFLDSAIQRAQDARLLLRTKLIPDKLTVLSEYYDVLAKVYHQKGNLRQSGVYMDSLLHIKDSIHFKKNINLLANLETQLNAEQHLAKLNAVELEKKKEQLLRNTIIVLSLLIMIILYLIYSKWMLKKRKNLELSLVEKEKEIEQKKNEISLANEQLVGYIKKVQEKSTMVERLQQDIETMYPEYADNHSDIKQRKLLLEKLHSSSILTEEDWTEFKSIFERVHDGFFSRALSNYPELTIAEVRFMALTRLGMSANEMANMLGISPDSVKRSVRRLRTKINVSSSFHFDELVKGL